MNLKKSNLLRESSVYRFISEEMDRTTKAFEACSENDDRDAWRLMNYCFRLKQIAERRIGSGNQALSKSGNQQLAEQCHELLEALLESIGVHAHEKYLIIEHLALRLRGSATPANEVLATRSTVGTEIFEIHKSAHLSNSSISGIVIDHLDDSAVIRFNVAGESEEREFFWNELNATPKSLPLGSTVIGETRLSRAPAPSTDQKQDLEFQNVREQIRSDLKSQGIDPQTIVGTEATDELRERSARVWVGNLKGHSQSKPDEG